MLHLFERQWDCIFVEPENFEYFWEEIYSFPTWYLKKCGRDETFSQFFNNDSLLCDSFRINIDAVECFVWVQIELYKLIIKILTKESILTKEEI